ncbi:GNAT family N-acetyltransferase [Fulvivirgaceae bacterium BMA12]|uniref:GNAT family N-acetyltransferase n=1 Tax=Agaribacillus aureus TaxID=3051825 RepID=A0ABT8LAC6_9BACT|nr:GNAT family N-acetyltransferase [Fulvivirgaceae bacterium BMA12]
MDLSLSSMDQNEFEQFLDLTIPDYAEDKIKAGSWSLENALPNAKRDFNRLLPQGIQTKNHFLKNIVTNHQKIGSIWYAVKDDDQPAIAFLYQIYIEQDFRSKGYGSLAMKVLKNEVAALGIDHIWLHVFAHNSKALPFYQRLGFKISDYTLHIDLRA